MRRFLIGALPLLALLLLPAIHPGAWAHRDGLDEGEIHVCTGDGGTSLTHPPVGCSLCLAFSQARTSLTPYAPTASAGVRLAAGAATSRAAPAVRPAPDPGVRGPRAPPAA